jgi:hypothetical protein
MAERKLTSDSSNAGDIRHSRFWYTVEVKVCTCLHASTLEQIYSNFHMYFGIQKCEICV